jgi:hypothetical protein
VVYAVRSERGQGTTPQLPLTRQPHNRDVGPQQHDPDRTQRPMHRWLHGPSPATLIGGFAHRRIIFNRLGQTPRPITDGLHILGPNGAYRRSPCVLKGPSHAAKNRKRLELEGCPTQVPQDWHQIPFETRRSIDFGDVRPPKAWRPSTDDQPRAPGSDRPPFPIALMDRHQLSRSDERDMRVFCMCVRAS